MPERLFVYGTLMKSDVQKSVVGREITGEPDILKGFTVKTVCLEGEYYPMIFLSKNECVEGIIIELDEQELNRTDAYEGSEYKRDRVTMVSGITAWVYTNLTAGN